MPLWRGSNHVAIRQLADDFARYPYLPRLRDTGVLSRAISDGLNLTSWDTDTFAYASSWDEKKERYRDMVKPPRLIPISDDDPGLLVKADVAAAQFEAEEKKPRSGEIPLAGTSSAKSGASATLTATPGPKPPKRFHGSVRMDPLRLGRDAGQIAEAVVQHLSTLHDAEVEITLEIQATMPDGAPEKTVRTVSENARTLKFTTQGFEEE